MPSVAVETQGLLSQKSPASETKVDSDVLNASQTCWKWRYERGLLYTLLVFFTTLAVLGQTRKLWAHKHSGHTGGVIGKALHSAVGTKRTVVYHHSFTLNSDDDDSSSDSNGESDSSKTCCDIADEEFDCEAEDINEFCDCSEVCSKSQGSSSESNGENSDGNSETQTTAAAAAEAEERRRLIVDKFLCCDVEFTGGVCSAQKTYNVTVYCEEHDGTYYDDSNTDE